jgi:hypothetical protein
MATATLTKRCSICKEDKPVTEFSPCKNLRLGVACWCKPCNAKRTREYRARNIEKVRASERLRASTERHRQINNAATHRYKLKNKSKRRASGFINRGIADGSIVRPVACETRGCIAVKLNAHHDDYSKPFDVRWLCVLCHREFHSKKSGV